MMKPIVTDTVASYVYYIKGTNHIFGSYTPLNQPLASIQDVEKHREIWDCPLVVREGNFNYRDGQYMVTGKN